jgi:hypothetical protein
LLGEADDVAGPSAAARPVVREPAEDPLE